ncbi:arabinose efflux permease [Gynuella sunshinyii YC6258]|uniref:Arabinose efflux permease n=2 Tax=Gynuella sunshinyii TaxID=1445505 RepID=A0A0C5VRK9_9GAMM|nr:arabinose efflux permease [Gynuella sunshinyii YC6258]
MFKLMGRFPAVVWVIICGTFLSRFTYFMIWPFLAVLLYRQFGMSEGQVGLILGLGSLSGTTIGLWIGHLSDRIGRSKIILAGCGLGVLAFLAMATAEHVYSYIFGIMATGISRAMLEPPGKALISDAIEDIPVRELAFHLRYYLLNLGAAAGPVVGLTFGLVGQQQTFLLTAVSFVLYMVGLMVVFKRHKPDTPQPARSATGGLAATVSLLMQDRAFLLLVLANILVMLCYAQIDAPLLQYLSLAGTDYAVSLVTWLVVANAATILCLQFPLLKLMRLWPLDTRINVSLMFFALAFIMFLLIPPESARLWIVAVVVLSAGEVVLFPTLGLKIDRLAPAHLKGSYFGAAGLYGYGYALGPVVGGFLLQYFGGQVLWGTMFLLVLLALVLVHRSRNAARPVFETELTVSQ